MLSEGTSSLSELAAFRPLGPEFVCRDFGFGLSVGDFALGCEDSCSNEIARATSSSEVDLPLCTTMEASVNCAARCSLLPCEEMRNQRVSFELRVQPSTFQPVSGPSWIASELPLLQLHTELLLPEV
jgi:hypothetical protein